GSHEHIVYFLRSSDYGLDGTLLEDLAPPVLPSPPFPGTDGQITNLTVTFNAQTNGGVNFQRMPTNCNAGVAKSEVTNYANRETAAANPTHPSVGTQSVPSPPA